MLKSLITLFLIAISFSQVKAQTNYLGSVEQNKISLVAFTRSGNNLVVATTYLLDSVTDVNGRCVPMLLLINTQTNAITYITIGDTIKANDEILYPKIVEVTNDSIIEIVGVGINNYFYNSNDYFIYKKIYNLNTQTSQNFKYPLFTGIDVWPKVIKLRKLDFNGEHIYYGNCGLDGYAGPLSGYFIKTDQNDSLIFTRIERGEKDDVYGYPLGTIINRNDSLIAFNITTNKYGEINVLGSDSFNILSQFEFWRGFSEGLGQNNLYSSNRCEIATVNQNNNVYQLIVSDTFNKIDRLFERYSIRKLNVNNYTITNGTVLNVNFDSPHDFYYDIYDIMKNALLVNEAKNTVFAYINSTSTMQQFTLYKFDTLLNIVWEKDFIFDPDNLYNRYFVEDMLQTDNGVYITGKITDRFASSPTQFSFLYFISNDGAITGINNPTKAITRTAYIFPNPANTYFQVPANSNKVTVINTLGEVVISTDNTNNIIDVAHLSNGIYYVQLLINNQWQSTKLVKQ
ncbi:MAG: T9SS type A sorting domain-containing protein [Bacteroidia bacterium]|nr:T9SS type A sorting domain-containing protein [Bacteroidia bacterium]MBP9689128.1 T9SS type A sorting domain-containing protein [Bacteroidia bacterium]